MANNNHLNRVRNDIDYSKYSVSELVKIIEFNNVGFPEPILRNLIARKEEAIPVLLDILKKVYDNYKRYAKEDDYFGHIYSIYLLAQFKVKDAYSMYVDMLKLPGDLPYELFGDSLFESTGRLLASFCGKEYEPIKNIITDGSISDLLRSYGVHAIVVLVAQGTIERDEALKYFKELLVSDSWDKNEEVVAEVVSACNDLYPAEVIDEIRAAYDKEQVDESVIELEAVEKTLKKNKDDVIEATKNDIFNRFIEDTIEEMKDWSCFYQDSYEVGNLAAASEKVGPNQLCPCGSGKKYKKCCG